MRKTIFALMIVISVIGLSSCTQLLNTPVTGVILNPSILSLAVGEQEQLTALVQPSSATDQTVVWTSNHPTIARVSSSGVVTAMAVGIATITVTTSDGGKTATCDVTVTAATTTTYSVSGTITLSGGGGLSGVTVSVSPGSASAATSGSGTYAISGLANGTYTVTPTLSGYSFTPSSESVTVSSANMPGVDFSATASSGGFGYGIQ